MTPRDRYANVNGLKLHYLDWGTRGEQPLIRDYRQGAATGAGSTF